MNLDEYKELVKSAPNDRIKIYKSEVEAICKLQSAAEREAAFRSLALKKLMSGTGAERYSVGG